MQFQYKKTKEGDALLISCGQKEKALWGKIFEKAELLKPYDADADTRFRETVQEFRASLWEDDDDKKKDTEETDKLFFGNRMVTAGMLLYDLLLDNYLVNQEITKKVLEAQIQQRKEEIDRLEAKKKCKKMAVKILQEIADTNRYTDIAIREVGDGNIKTFIINSAGNCRKAELVKAL